jgi:hypothetical protein
MGEFSCKMAIPDLATTIVALSGTKTVSFVENSTFYVENSSADFG